MNVFKSNSFARLVVFFCFANAFAGAQLSQLSFQHYTTNNGLSQASVYHMFQDSKGFMWFSSWDGLNRFDGYNFKIFKPSLKDTGSICGSRINSVMEDKDGFLWIGTYGALNKYDPETNRFEHFFVKDSKGTDLMLRYDPFFIDDKNELWFTYDSKNLASLNTDTKKITFYPFADNAMEEFVSAGFPKKEMYRPLTKIITSGYDGLRVIDVEKKQVHYYFSDHRANETGAKQLIWEFVEDQNKILWLASQSGLAALDHATGKVETFNEYNGGPAATALTTITIDKNKNIWCGTDGNGLWVFNIHTKKFIQHFTKNPVDAESLGENALTTIYIDREDNIWINSDPQGIDKINPSYQQFNHIRFTKDDENKIYSNAVWSITELDKNTVLACFNQTGLMIYDKAAHQTHLYHLPKGFKETSVYHSITDHNNRTWMASDAGIFYSDDKLKSIKQLNKRSYYYVYLFEDKDNLLVGADDGLFSLPLNLSTTVPDTIHLFDGKEISVIGGSPNGFICVTTYANEMFLLKNVNNRYELFKKMQFDFLIKSVWFENEDIVWLGTNAGLVRYTISSGTRKIYTEEDGLANNFIYGLLKGNDGNLWMSTNRGISRFDFHKAQFYNYGLAEGVQSWEFNSRSFFQSQAGTIYFGGVNGFNYFNPLQLKKIPFNPQVQLLNISINGKDVLLNNFLNTKQKNELKPQENNLAIEFAAIDFNRSNNINYLYKLRENDDWIPINNQRVLRFVNLPSGDYQLQVKAMYANYETSPHVLKLAFSILPPFYLTGWFVILTALIIAVIIYAIYKYRLNQLLKVQQVRNNIARDLHDDIGSTLGSIGMYSEVAASKLKKQQHEQAVEVVEKIGNASRLMIEKMGDIVWSINAGNDDLENLVQRMKAFAASMLTPKGIDFTFDLSDNINTIALTMEQRKNVFLIYKENIHNILKYSECSLVGVSLILSNQQLKMSIKDNGKGFNENEGAYNGNGLKNMRARAKDINATFEINSGINEGTLVVLSLPLK